MKFPGRPMQFAFPINGHHQEPYNKAVGDALMTPGGGQKPLSKSSK
jgi:hypothetical protein